MKHEEVFLKHILEEINFLLSKIEGKKMEELLADELLKRACARSLEIIGEAAKNISPVFQKKHTDIEWKKLAGLRDKIIHYYFGVNWDIVWDVIQNKLPLLKVKIESILQEAEV